jgi:periplasmic protein TonB
MPGADILDQRDPLGKPFLGSILFHGALCGLVLVSTVFRPKPIQLGDPTLHTGSIGVNMVKTIPIPRNEGITNRVANDTKSVVPEAPEPKVAPKPVVKEKLPDPAAIRIPTHEKVKPKRIERPATSNPFRPDRLPEPNQVYSRTPQAMVAPEYGMQGTNGVGVGPSSPFGEQFGWYAQQIQDRVSRKWNRADVTSRPHAKATVRFTLLRDGSVQNVQLAQPSGSYTLDTSAQRALLDAAPLPPLPPALNRNSITIDLEFELQQ